MLHVLTLLGIAFLSAIAAVVLVTLAAWFALWMGWF